MHFEVEHAIQWFNRTNEHIQAEKKTLTRLDQVIGDGDHGINMARGFEAVAGKLHGQTYVTVAGVLKDTAMTLISTVGGAAGPLYGTAFLRMATALQGKDNIDVDTFGNALEAALQGMKERGRAEKGEKTLIDVWEAVAELFSKAEKFPSVTLEETAKKAMGETEKLIATKGRAAYFKEKSVGHIDPGAASSYYLFASLAEILKGGQ